ncbi:MAG: ABC1 kinase family protein, partial [Candidatus Saccharicenans sp.]
HLSNGWLYQPKSIIEEFKKAIRKELDFTEEAYNFEKFRLNFRNVDYLKIPKIYWDLTTDKVLTMEFMEGVKINEITQEKYREVFEPKRVAQEGAEAVLKQILEDGFFQADPHPANLFVQPPATIVMLDVGMTGYLEKKSIMTIVRVLRAVADKDLDEIITGMEDLGIIMEAVDRNRLRQDLVELIERYSGRPLKTIKVSNLSQDIFELMVRHNLTVPSNLVLMIRALSIVESIGRELDPDFDMLSSFKPFVKRLLWRNYSPGAWLKKGEIILGQSLELVEHLPRDLVDLFRKLKEGQLKISFEHRGLENLTREIDRASNRISFSLIIAALIIGSSLLLQQKIGPTIFGVSAVGILGYLLASLLGVGLIVSILRSGKWK